MDYPIKFGAQFKQQARSLRKARGLTQAKLGELVGVTQRRIAEIEANPGVVAFDQVIALVSALGAELVLRDNAKAPMPSKRASSAQSTPYEFRSSLIPSARHLIATLAGETSHAPEALLWRSDEDADVPVQLTLEDRRRLVQALALALPANPRVLEAQMSLAAQAEAGRPRAAADVAEIHAQWASALALSPAGLREAVLATIADRRAPRGLGLPPSKGRW